MARIAKKYALMSPYCGFQSLGLYSLRKIRSFCSGELGLSFFLTLNIHELSFALFQKITNRFLKQLKFLIVSK